MGTTNATFELIYPLIYSTSQYLVHHSLLVILAVPGTPPLPSFVSFLFSLCFYPFLVRRALTIPPLEGPGIGHIERCGSPVPCFTPFFLIYIFLFCLYYCLFSNQPQTTVILYYFVSFLFFNHIYLKRARLFCSNKVEKVKMGEERRE